MDISTLLDFYEKEHSSVHNLNIGQNLVQTVLLTLFLFTLVVILYTRVFLSIDSVNWDVQKCSPKYIFYSGYIKRNPNSTSLNSTIDNFNECIVKYNNQGNDPFSDILEKNSAEHLQKSRELVSDHNKMSRQRILDLQQKVNSKNQEFQIKLDNIKNSSQTDELQEELRKLNDIMRDVKDYSHSYLTYAMMNFTFKHKIAEKNETLDDFLNPAATCGGLGATECNSDVYCSYNGHACSNIKKGEFYEQEAIKLNDTIKQYFGNNKL